jgi:DNA-binding MarR family transcriptional regulator
MKMIKKSTPTSFPRSRPTYDKDYAALASLRRSLRNFLVFSEQAARRSGLTPQQHQAILAIRGFGSENGITVGDLAAHLLLKHHTAVGLADRLVRAKLVVRTPDKRDRRRVLLTLTAKADRALKKLSATHRSEIRRNAPQLIRLLRDLSKQL